MLAIRCCDQFTLQAFFSRNHTGAGSLIYIGMLKKLCNSPLLLQEVEWAAAAAAPGGGMGLGVPFNPLYRARSPLLLQEVEWASASLLTLSTAPAPTNAGAMVCRIAWATVACCCSVRRADWW